MPENNNKASAENGHDSPDEMSAEELAAFNKIMGEIEGGDDSSDVESTIEAGNNDSAADLEDEFSAELEKVVEEADAAGDETAAAPPDASDEDELDADQQKAFESIMAQIGGADSAASGSDEKEADHDSSSDSEGEFSAELEKVVMEADAADDETATESSLSDADDLDEDQQKAFESIMAQIGGGDDTAGEEDPEKEADADGTEIGEDGFATEPENVVADADGDATEVTTPGLEKAAETVQPEAIEADADEGSDESVGQAQQEAFESIMAQIEGAKSEPDSAQEAQVSSEDRPTEKPQKRQEESGSEHAGSNADGDVEDISTDIDDILKEVAVEEETPESPDADAIEIVTEQEPVDRETGKSDGKPDRQGKSAEPAPDAGDRQTRVPAAVTEKTEEALSTESEAADRSAGKSSSTDKTLKAAVPLRETGQSAETKWKKIAVGASAVALLVVVLVGYSYWSGRFVREVPPPRTAPEKEDPAAAAQTPQPVPPQPQESIDAGQDPTDQSRLKAMAASLENLRGAMLAKQDEIEELRAYYKAGIDAEIQGVVRTLRSRNDNKMSHTAAKADPRISLGMEAIQRRDAYIRKLAAPAETLVWTSEELLYFSRKANLLERMTTKTSDIDVDGFIGQAEEIIVRHTESLAKLNIDAVPASPLPTETIWKDIVKLVPEKGKQTGAAVSGTDNAAISESICRGDFALKHKLTELTAETARCLAKWNGKDLFLNEIKKLHPEAARQLAAWEGEWLGLNGLVELSPEAATHLSRWKGKGLSLNGLARLSPRVVAILSEWQGDQIELVNVRHMAHWENPNTRLFLSEELDRKRNTARN